MQSVYQRRLTINDSKATLAGDVVDDCLQAAQVGLVERAGEARRGGAQTLHQEWNTEGVEALAHEELAANIWLEFTSEYTFATQ